MSERWWDNTSRYQGWRAGNFVLVMAVVMPDAWLATFLEYALWKIGIRACVQRGSGAPWLPSTLATVWTSKCFNPILTKLLEHSGRFVSIYWRKLESNHTQFLKQTLNGQSDRFSWNNCPPADTHICSDAPPRHLSIGARSLNKCKFCAGCCRNLDRVKAAVNHNQFWL